MIWRIQWLHDRICRYLRCNREVDRLTSENRYLREVIRDKNRRIRELEEVAHDSEA